MKLKSDRVYVTFEFRLNVTSINESKELSLCHKLKFLISLSFQPDDVIL